VVLLGSQEATPGESLSTLPRELSGVHFRDDDEDRWFVWIDDCYGDRDGDGVPEIPVSRIPDRGDPTLIPIALGLPRCLFPAPARVSETSFALSLIPSSPKLYLNLGIWHSAPRPHHSFSILQKSFTLCSMAIGRLQTSSVAREPVPIHFPSHSISALCLLKRQASFSLAVVTGRSPFVNVPWIVLAANASLHFFAPNRLSLPASCADAFFHRLHRNSLFPCRKQLSSRCPTASVLLRRALSRPTTCTCIVEGKAAIQQANPLLRGANLPQRVYRRT